MRDRKHGAAAMLVAVCVASASFGLGHASAQRGAISARVRATRALDNPDLSRCAERSEWAGRKVEAALVVFPDGAYGVTLGTVTPAMGREGDRAGLARCIETSLGLGDLVPLPPRSAFVITRELEVPASDTVAAAIAQRLAASRTDFDRCVREHAPVSLARIDVVARVEVRGGRIVASGSRSDLDARVALCVRHALRDATGIPDGTGIVTATVTRERAPAGTLPRSDGTEGAICHWGERDQETYRGRYVLPEPSPCRAGLVCCGGGRAENSRGCRRGARCPRLP